ncbi:hypothetical protein BDN72DRAFT_840709 [Pluteus cervinus]|uniref:Uncharacterized protein n=1 Tax=Pluteus cervinus TaxID=181527 RepID=A0ACD3AU16_9AGAR|nr:hypothetical protein BDN72DRAFT_840709 [Pluteus cervinus]
MPERLSRFALHSRLTTTLLHRLRLPYASNNGWCICKPLSDNFSTTTTSVTLKKSTDPDEVFLSYFTAVFTTVLAGSSDPSSLALYRRIWFNPIKTPKRLISASTHMVRPSSLSSISVDVLSKPIGACTCSTPSAHVCSADCGDSGGGFTSGWSAKGCCHLR